MDATVVVLADDIAAVNAVSFGMVCPEHIESGVVVGDRTLGPRAEKQRQTNRNTLSRNSIRGISLVLPPDVTRSFSRSISQL